MNDNNKLRNNTLFAVPFITFINTKHTVVIMVPCLDLPHLYPRPWWMPTENPRKHIHIITTLMSSMGAPGGEMYIIPSNSIYM